MQASFSNSLARCCEAEGPHMQRCLSAQPQAFRGCRPLCACSIAAYTYARQWPSQSSMSVHQSQRNSRLVPRPGGASPVSRSRYVVVCAQDRDRNLVQADLYVLVSICLTFQILSIVAAPGFSWWQVPRLHPGRFASFLQLGATATISWLAANLVVSNFQNSVAADVRETFRRVLLAYMISLPVTSCQLEVQHMASGWTAVDAVSIRRVAGVLGAMSLWRIGFSLYYEHWTNSMFSGHWLGGEGGPETQKALRSIGVAVLIFILTWEVATKQLQSGALDSFARSIVQSPGSLLE